MANLIRSILNLPRIKLEKDEWAALRTIKASFDLNIRGHREACIKAFADKPFHHKPEVQCFITSWINLAEAINHWMTQLRATWQEVINKPLSADELLPLVIELLPNNIDTLKQISISLKIANEVDYTSSFAYSITTIFQAASFKHDCMQNHKKISHSDKLYDRVSKVKEHIHKIEDEKSLHTIELLHSACELYLNQSLKKIISTTDTEPKLFENKSAEENYQQLIKLNASDEAFTILASDQKFQKQLNNFIIITGMFLTLINEKTPTKRLQSFAHQLAHHTEQLDNHPNSDLDRLLEEIHLLMKLPRAYKKTSVIKNIRSSIPSLPSLSLPSITFFKKMKKKKQLKHQKAHTLKKQQTRKKRATPHPN